MTKVLYCTLRHENLDWSITSFLNFAKNANRKSFFVGKRNPGEAIFQAYVGVSILTNSFPGWKVFQCSLHAPRLPSG